ncbi:ribonuclease domain-containing protein [Streptomyces luteireticuli]|uniref:Uncharacterized protein n=1 Tax=Streptomyces luteireticuli TaxID=173858 RepID=A0ABN0YB60_9ACTN
MSIPHRIAKAGVLAALASSLLLGGTALAAPAPSAPLSGTALASVGHVCYSALPSQAHDTLDLIDEGGPYPYPKDGTVFSNREGVLPKQRTGYYHEYTVVTPGSPDRGARRIITGEQSQEDYYTADHYRSFSRVDFGC